MTLTVAKMRGHFCLLALWLGLACSCMTSGKVEADPPKQFAVEDDPRGENIVLSSVSYNGVSYRVRTVPNTDDPGDLDFWQKALENHLSESGYILKKSGSVEAGGRTGSLSQFLAPLPAADFQFNVALFVTDEQIVIVEAAGEVAAYKKVAKAVEKALQKLRFG